MNELTYTEGEMTIKVTHDKTKYRSTPKAGLICNELPFGIWEESETPISDDEAENWYNVTHLPTGWRLLNCASLEIAKTVLALVATANLDWSFTDGKTAPKATGMEFFRVVCAPYPELLKYGRDWTIDRMPEVSNA